MKIGGACHPVISECPFKYTLADYSFNGEKCCPRAVLLGIKNDLLVVLLDHDDFALLLHLQIEHGAFHVTIYLAICWA